MKPSPVDPSFYQGKAQRPNQRELAELKKTTTELGGIHIIAGTKVTSAIEQFSAKARAAGATIQTFDTLTAMAAAIREKNYGKIVILADSSMTPTGKEIREISDARGERKKAVPILLTRHGGKESLPLNVTPIASTQEGIQHFSSTVLQVLEQRIPA